jgi:glycosyltransferase involved in cell wall biosynthesis
VEKKHYPKVLVISSSSFNDYNGTGVTMSNLFREWPKDKLAVIHSDNLFEPNREICLNNYKHGLGDRRIFLLSSLINLFNKTKSIILSSFQPTQSSANENRIEPKQDMDFTNKKLFKIVVGIFGNLEPFSRIILTDKMKNWILDFDPEIIYSTFSTIGYMKFISEVKTLTKAELVVHFMDDWPSIVYKKGFLSPIFRLQMKIELKKILKNSKVKICIGSTMSQEYKIRYGYDFLSFSNPEDSILWEKVSSRREGKSDFFKVLYIGTFNSKNINTIGKLGNTIDRLHKSGNNIQMELYSFQPRADNYRSIFEKKDSVRVKEVPENLEEFRELLCSGDLLIIPLDFTNECVERMRLSFFTKIPAYMFSGVPILLCGPIEIGVVKEAKQDGWAYVVSEDSETAMEDAIIRLINMPKLRQDLIQKSKIVAKEKYDADVVREKFRLSFLSSLSQ